MDLITTHLNADFDGLASMVAARKLYPGATLVFPAGAQEHVRKFLALHDVGISKLSDIDLSQVKRLILVDVQEPERIGPFQKLFHNPNVEVHIYDHHPLHDQPKDSGRIQHFGECVGANTTILIDRLQAQQISLSPFEATILAIGIYEETGSLRYGSTTPKDLDATAALLRAEADLNVVSDILHDHLVPEEITLLNDLLLTSETLYLNGRKFLLAASAYDRFKGDLSEVARKLNDLEGYDAIIAAMMMEDKIQIVARSRHDDIDVGALAEQFGGGGHPNASSAIVKGKTLVEVKEQLRDRVQAAFGPSLKAQDVMTTPVKAVEEGTTVLDTERSMTQLGVNVLPVLTARGRYVGIVTRETIQKALFHKLTTTPIETVMQTDVYKATPDTPFLEIQAHMLDRNQRFVPIVKGSRVVGVITRTDLLRTLHHDVLEASQAPSKGQEPITFKKHRNVRSLLKERLPNPAFSLLKAAGELAETRQVGLYAVGGFVRDLLLATPNLDIDLVVEGNGMTFAKDLAREQHARVKVHERFGTASVIFPEGFKLDVATARTEYYEFPTALPTVEQSSIKKDLYRRDFTINTLAVRLNSHRFGEVVDFYGGQRDLNDQCIRVLHSLSFIEDPTRVFRAIRFEQRLGFRLGKETVTLIKGAVKMDLFQRLSKSRLLDELILLFSEKEPRNSLARMAELDLLKFIHPQLKWSPSLARLLKHVEESLKWYGLLYLDRAFDAWVVYFMALLETLPAKEARDTLARLRIPSRQIKKMRWVGRSSTTLLRRLNQGQTTKPSEIYRLLCDLPDEVLVFLMAKTKSEIAKRKISSFFTHFLSVKPYLNGKDLKSMGLKPGPLFKHILDQLLDARLNGEVHTKEDERHLAQRILERS